MNERFNAVVGANISKFRKKMAEVNKIARKTASDIVKDIKADDSQFKKKMWGIKKDLAALPKKVWIDIQVRTEKFQNKIAKIANVMRSFQEISQNTMQGSLISVSPAIVPILASIVGLVGTLGPMIGVLGASTFALATAFGFAGVAAVGFGAAAVPALTKIFDGSELVTKSQKEARKAFEGFKKTWNDITKSVEKPILQATAKAFNAFNKILQMSRPLFQSVATAVNNLMTAFNQSLNTAPVKAFFDYLNKQGGPMLETLGKAAGNFLQGLMSMMTAFGPLAETTAQGFLNMSKGFAEWAAGLSKSEKFQAFISYVQENMPKIRAIFRDALAGIIYFFTAFGPLSSDMMTSLQGLMGKFKQWASDLGSNQAFQTFLGYIRDNAPKVMTLIGNLWDLLINLAVALAPIGSKILDIANSFLSWTNGMMETHPIIGKIVGVAIVLGGILLALIPNIIALSTFFGGLGGTIMKVLPFFGKLGTGLLNIGAKILPRLIPMLGTIIDVIWNLGTAFLRNAARIAASWIIAMGPIGWVIIAVVALVALIIIYWDQIKAATIAAWTTTVNFLVAAWDLIKTYAMAKFNSLVTLLTTIWTAVKTAAILAWQIITTYLMQKWNSIKSTATAIFNGIKSFLVAVWNGIKSGISTAVSSIVSFVTNGWNRLKSTTSSVYNAIKSAITTAWNNVKSTTSTIVSNILSTVKTKFEALKSAVAEKMAAAKEKIVSIWNQAKSFLEGINLYDIGVNIIQGLINGIGSMASAVASKVSDIASGIKDKITGALGIHSPSRFMKWVGEMAGTGLVKGIGGMIKPVANMATKMAQASMIQPQRSAIGFESSGFGELRKSISVSNDSNKEKIEAEKVQGDTIIRLEIDSEVLGAAVIPHVDDSQSREIRTRMAVMGVL